VGGDSKAQGFVQLRRRAEAGGAAREQGSDVLAGDLEFRTVCRPAKSIFGAEIRGEESQTPGHSRPARGLAEYAMNAKPEFTPGIIHGVQTAGELLAKYAPLQRG